MNPARCQTATTLRFVNAGSEYQSLPAHGAVPGAASLAGREDGSTSNNARFLSPAALEVAGLVPAVGNCTHALIAAYFKLRFTFLFGLVKCCSAAFMELFSGFYFFKCARFF